MDPKGTDAMDKEIRLEPGIYPDISWDEYKRIPYPSPSVLKSGLRSMKRLKRALDGETKRPSEKTTAIGNATHCLIAGEQNRLAVMPAFEKDESNLTAGTIKTPPKKPTKGDGSLSEAGKRWAKLCEKNGKPADYAGEIAVGQERTESKSTKYYQSKSESFYEENEGKSVLTEVQEATALKIVSNIWANKECAKVINDSDKEVTVIARVDGVLVKTRMDFLNLRDARGADLKTTDDIEPKAFYRTCKRFNYLFQFGCHSLFLANAGDQAFQLQGYDVIAAEVGEDYDVGLINILPFTVIDIWAEKAKQVINEYSLANASGNWLGLYPHVGILEVPEYDMSENQVDFVQWGQ